uniref:STAS domain-containing protein n=1 Tax=Panagrolaimus sp. ES5 TaxID=591445 RepID=A0AC34FET0_9BILA
MFFGTSMHASLGSFAVVSLMTGVTNENIMGKYYGNNATEIFEMDDYSMLLINPITIASTLAFTVGICELVIALLRLDFLCVYFSDPLVGGFTTGAAVHVLASQLDDIMGIKLTRMIVTTFISNSYSWHNLHNVPVVGAVPKGLPTPHMPQFNLIPDCLPTALAISVVTFAVHISMAKMIAKRLSYEIDPSQEMYAVGFTSALSGLFPVFPCSIALARTMVTMIWITSFAATVCIDVIGGFAVSIAFALFTVILRTQWPNWGAKITKPVLSQNGLNFQRTCIFKFESFLLFTNAERFKKAAYQVLNSWIGHLPGIRENDKAGFYFVFDCSALSQIDTMGINAIKDVISEIQLRTNALIYYANAREELIDLLLYSKVAESHDEFVSSVDEFLTVMNLRPFQRTETTPNFLGTEMVKPKTLRADYVKEFIDQRKKVSAARSKCVDELDQLIKSLAPKLKEEYVRGTKRALKDFDNKMKMFDFLKLATLNNEPEPSPTVTQITVKSKPPRAPRRAEMLFSVDGTPIRI